MKTFKITTSWTGFSEITIEADTLEEALRAFHMVTRLEGIMPALETAHAFAALDYLTDTFSDTDNIVVNVSGRGDKDINTVATMDGISLE